MAVCAHVNYSKVDGNLAATSRQWLSLNLVEDLVQIEPRLYLDPLNGLFPLPNSETA